MTHGNGSIATVKKASKDVAHWYPRASYTVSEKMSALRSTSHFKGKVKLTLDTKERECSGKAASKESIGR
jgi:hypothetical protein